MGTIQIGYFRDFLGEPEVLLLDADVAGLDAMVEFATKLSRGESASLNAILTFANCPSVTFEVAENDFGLTKSDASWMCRWSRPVWESIADDLRAMQGQNSSHQFLGTPDQEPTVIFSTGEYGPSWWKSVV